VPPFPQIGDSVAANAFVDQREFKGKVADSNEVSDELHITVAQRSCDITTPTVSNAVTDEDNRLTILN